MSKKNIYESVRPVATGSGDVYVSKFPDIYVQKGNRRRSVELFAQRKKKGKRQKSPHGITENQQNSRFSFPFGLATRRP
jgi:hypothetical protein